MYPRHVVREALRFTTEENRKRNFARVEQIGMESATHDFRTPFDQHRLAIDTAPKSKYQIDCTCGHVSDTTTVRV